MPKAGEGDVSISSESRVWVGEGGREGLTHDQNGHEHLRPVCLMSGLEGCDELTDEECQHRDHDSERDRRVREHEACDAGGEQSAYHRWHELGRYDQW